MTLLEQIFKGSTNPQSNDEPLDYPFTLTTQTIIPNLKPPSHNPFAPLQPLTGFQISQSDCDLIAASFDFYKKLKRKLKSPQSLTSISFIKMVNFYFERIGEIKFEGLDGLVVKGGDEDEGYCCKLVEKLGSFVGRDVMGLVIEGCVLLGNWRVLETLIVNKLIVDNGVRSDLLYHLVSKGKCDLVCLCLRHFGDLEALDLGRVLKCFLSPSKDGCLSMLSVRDEWERDASSAIDKVSDKKLNAKKFGFAKEAILLLMVAYDQFLPSELCLHFVLSSSNVDEVVFSSAVSKLNSGEMLEFIKYLGKWLRKYERFPQVGPCPKAAAKLGLYMCQWVPRLEDVVKALGLVVDEHFSSLAMHSEFHEELKAVNGVASSLVLEGRLCCSVANVIELLKPEIGESCTSMGETGKRFRGQSQRDNYGDNKNQRRRTEQDDRGIGDELVAYRILCPDTVIGSVIGKAGKVINLIRQETRAKVKVEYPFPGSKDRVITILCYVKEKVEIEVDDEYNNKMPLCPAQDALLRMHAAIANAVSELG